MNKYSYSIYDDEKVSYQQYKYNTIIKKLFDFHKTV